jgi:hypothetical protein
MEELFDEAIDKILELIDGQILDSEAKSRKSVRVSHIRFLIFLFQHLLTLQSHRAFYWLVALASQIIYSTS